MNKGMFTSKTDNWSTPQAFFDELNEEFMFTLDPCADAENHKCELWYSKEDDGLTKDWGGEVVFCNPPYGRSVGKWVKKCHDEAQKGNAICVMLLPARTDTRWFHDYIYGKAHVRFLKGRLCFGDGKGRAPFPSMVVVFGEREEYGR